MKIRLCAHRGRRRAAAAWRPAPSRSAARPRLRPRPGSNGLAVVDVTPSVRSCAASPPSTRSRPRRHGRAQGPRAGRPADAAPAARARARHASAPMQAAVTTGVANDVYPDERDPAPRHRVVRRDGRRGRRAPTGFTGKGVTVAVVDSRLRRQPSRPRRPRRPQREARQRRVRQRAARLEQHDRRPERDRARTRTPTSAAATAPTSPASSPPTARPTPRPPRRRADANLVCFSIGEVLFTTAVVTAYDHMLDQPDLWGIDVVNNSWGNSFRQFDPRDPVAVVTKAVADHGVTVVFAAGNSGTRSRDEPQPVLARRRG